jgi:hypothetical protein
MVTTKRRDRSIERTVRMTTALVSCLNRRVADAALLVLFASLVVGGAACGSPSEPSKQPSPPPVNNPPPTITSLTVGAARVEAGNDVAVTAVVEDAEVPIDQLTYDWSATPANGTFSGTGRQVTWKAPFLQPPSLYTLTLKVTEKYMSSGVQKENSATASGQVHYNDSYREINIISMRFLTELFPNFSVTAQQAVQDFSDSTNRQSDGSVCADEKARELTDIANNRINFHILSGTYTNVSINLNGDKTFADVLGTCVFEDIPQEVANPYFGRKERVTGVCHLTAVYEKWNWFLCKSNFAGTGTMPENVRYRVPGQIVDLRDLPQRVR